MACKFEYKGKWYSEAEIEDIYTQLGTSAQKAGAPTLGVIKAFNERVGISTESVANITVNGQRIGANGIAFPMQKLVQVVYGKESEALPEESMHIAVELLEQKNPTLFNEMLNRIGKYQVYQDIFNTYSKNPFYQVDGKPDIRKIKKEAIGKVLAQTIVTKLENNLELPERVAAVEGWWGRVKAWLKSFFNKAGYNPFIDFSEQIIAGTEDLSDVDLTEDNSFLQITDQNKAVDDIVKAITSISSKTVLVGQNTPDRHYEVNGVRIFQSVTEKVKRKSKNRFKNQKFTEQQLIDNEEYRKHGLAGHADMEHLIKEIFTDKDGYILPTPNSDSGYVSQISSKNKEIYNTLKTYLSERLKTYPPGTRVLSEVTGYNGKIGKDSLSGTIDFIAIIPDAKTGVKIDILDWKFRNMNTDKYSDIPWFSIEEWNAQMDEYRNILQSYGVKSNQFRQTRMIPILTSYENKIFKNPKAGKKVVDVELSNPDVKIEGKAYLLPVPTESEEMEDERLSPLVKKLRALYERIEKREVEDHRKDLKARELNALFSTIRQMQVRGNLEPLVNQAKTINEYVKRTIKKYDKLDPSKMTQKEKSDYINEIGEAIDNLSIYTNLHIELKAVFEGDLTEEEKKLKEDIRDTAIEASDLLDEVKKLDKVVAQRFVVDGRVNKDLSLPEVARDFLQRNLVALSNQTTTALQTLSRISKEIVDNYIIDRDDELAKIKKIEKTYIEWAKSKGLSGIDIFNPLINKKTHKFIDEISDKFFDQLSVAIEKEDIKWIKENVDFDGYSKVIDEIKARRIAEIEEDVYLGTDEEVNKKKKAAKEQVNDTYDLKGNGRFIKSKLKEFVKKELWYSDEYNELRKSPEAVEALEYFKGRNEWMKEVGYLSEYQQPRNFIPFAQKSYIEGLQTGTNISLMERFIRNFTVTESDTAYGDIDPITKRIVNKVPKFLIRDNAPDISETEKDYSGYSTDLFKMYDAINAFSLKWKYTTDREAQVMQLQRIEESKPSLRTSNASNTIIKEGRTGDDIDDLDINPSNAVNSQLLSDMTKAVIYGQRYVENNDMAFGSVTKLAKIGQTINKAINKAVGKEVLPEKDIQERKLSVYKTVDTINRGFRLKMLGFNFITGGVNFLGGSTQNLINAGKFFTSGEYAKNSFTLAFRKFSGTEGQLITSLLDHFAPMLDDENRRKNKDLSASAINRIYMSDILLKLQTSGDEFIQNNVALSMLQNAVIIDGKIENAREYVAKSDAYKARYNQGVTPEQRRAIEKSFETQVQELLKSSSLMSKSKIINDKLVIEGIDQRKDPSILKYREAIQRISKDATGNMSDDDRRGLNLSVFGSSFMMFKNWIPRMFEVRMGRLSEHGDTYEWGRLRMVANVLLSETKFSLSTLHSMLTGGEKGMEALRKLYEKKKADFKRTTGGELKMSEEEFFDMVRQGIKNQYKDALFMLSLLGIFLAAKALPPDKDEDPYVTNGYKFLLRSADKLTDELSFYYNPISMQQILNGSVFPALGAITSATRLINSLAEEGFGLVLEEGGFDKGTELRESAKPIKYALKTFRIANQFANYLPLFAPDMAKDLGIKVTTESRLR